MGPATRLPSGCAFTGSSVPSGARIAVTVWPPSGLIVTDSPTRTRCSARSSNTSYLWQGARNYVELAPGTRPAHILRIRGDLATGRDFDPNR
jgi:hypothetical protein